jgi:hypothetical protein
MNDADHIDDRTDAVTQANGTLPQNIASLKPKGACWYCNHPLDNVRRFCSKTCGDDYRIEEAFNNPPP